MSIQSEAALEAGLIATLRKMDYEYVQIAEDENLQANFKRQLEIHNRKRLAEHGRTEFTDGEFEKILIYLEGGTRFERALKRLKNSVTSIRLTRQTANASGWNFSTASSGVRTSFRFPTRLRWRAERNAAMT